MGKLVLVRHGESRWNLSNRFTGWIDIPLSENGIKEAGRCAVHCKDFDYSAAYTSTLTRAQETLLIILSGQARTGIFQHADDTRYSGWIRNSNRRVGDDIPIFSSSALNERYYGMLQGMDKTAAERKYGKDKVKAWRRGYADKPPHGESLEEAHARMHPYLVRNILPKVRRGETVLVTAHGNTLRAAIKHLEGISDQDISYVDLPEAKPLVYEYSRGRYQRIEGEYGFDRPLR
ncbi:histidine phosphatase family protein [Candidatus Uhrbacteria bacterium]|nr:histidine phosphatase family protein [Candidatus Uhrbacteria bacterium]